MTIALFVSFRLLSVTEPLPNFYSRLLSQNLLPEVKMEAPLPAELVELKTRFDQWRATRKYKSEPVPDDLRSATLEMTRRFPSSLLQQVLKVQLWHLKKRGAAKRPAPAVNCRQNQSCHKLHLRH
jgi:hypothetical protein